MKKLIAVLVLSLLNAVLLPGRTSTREAGAAFMIAPPTVYFKNNSLEFAKALQGSPSAKQAIETIRKTLTGDPTIAVMEIQGHCDSSEKDPAALSQKRADKVMAELIGLGIARKRLTAKGYGITKLRVEESVIEKEPKASQKETLRALNRRCVYKVISWTDE